MRLRLDRIFPNLFACLALGIGLSAVTAAWATDYGWGAGAPVGFSIPATDNARDYNNAGNFDQVGTGGMGIYWRGSVSDRTYIHYDLSSLQGRRLTNTYVNLNYKINATWGGNVTGSTINSANGAWTATVGGADPGCTAISGANNATGNLGEGAIASWGIPVSTFTNYIGSSSFYGLALKGASGTTANFYGGTASLTGSYLGPAVSVLGGTDWSAATWTDASQTLTIAGTSDVSGGNVTLSAGTTLVVAGSATLGGGSFAGTFTNSGTLSLGSSASQVLSGAISGPGFLTKSGNGTLVLTSTNTYTGTTSNQAGTLRVTDLSTYRSPTVIASWATFEANVTTGVNAANSFSFTGTGTLIKTGAGTWQVGNVGRVGIGMGAGGFIDVQQGMIQTGSHQGSWTGNQASMHIAAGASVDLPAENLWVDALTGGGTIMNSYAPSGGRTVYLGVANGSGTFDGIITSGSLLALNKNGTGTQILTGTNTYTGGTTVSGGTLLVNGSLAAGSAVTVNANGTLGGTGVIGGTVTVQDGGTLAPGGASPATLTINGDLIANSGAQLQFALGTQSALVAVNGNLVLGGTLNITDAGGFGMGTYTLFTGFSGLSWNAPSVGVLPPGYGASFDTNTPGQVKLVVGPSPFQLWQAQYFGDPNSPNAAPDADPDGDGVSNWNEFLAGTNPTNRDSVFGLTVVARESGGVRLTWTAAGGRTNVLQTAPEPYDASFNDLSGNIVLSNAGDTTTNYLDSAAVTNPGPRFYRVRQEPRPQPSSDQRLAWWRQARFGMFIHWDPSSILGLEISWSRGNTGIAITQIATNVYDNLYKQFNPTNFNADQWVQLAQSAGMKYMVLVTRHHDGFSMFDTQATNYMSDIGTTNIYKITAPECPFGRDVVKELASACHRAGMRFGVYYSQPDWVFTGSASDYQAYLKTQVRELMSSYGRVDVLWYDGLGGSVSTYDSVALNALARSLQPALLINNRNCLAEDFDTPEQTIGAFQTSRPWESCMTVSAHNQWAWGGANDGVKSLTSCLNMLVNCAGGDGNMLLNVGPRPDGIIDPEQANLLASIGGWLAQYGESIYDTRGGPFKPGAYGVSTYRTNTVYVHVLSWAYGSVLLPPIPARVLSSRVLTGGTATVVQTGAGIRLSVAPGDQQAFDTIVALDLDVDAGQLAPVDVPVPVSIANGAAASASNVYQNQAAYGAAQAVDGNLQSRWATDNNTTNAWLELDMGSPKTFSRAVIYEAYTGRVQSFQLQWFDGASWQTFWTGTTLGNPWSQSFPPVTAQRVRLNILAATIGPTIWEFQLFN
jgi:alpha-L-fucosidase